MRDRGAFLVEKVGARSKKKVSIHFQSAEKSVDPFPVGKKNCRTISSFDKKGIFCRSISVKPVDPFLVGVVDPFPEVVSIHFSRPL
jgi:hypothetical protein